MKTKICNQPGCNVKPNKKYVLTGFCSHHQNQANSPEAVKKQIAMLQNQLEQMEGNSEPEKPAYDSREALAKATAEAVMSTPGRFGRAFTQNELKAIRRGEKELWAEDQRPLGQGDIDDILNDDEPYESLQILDRVAESPNLKPRHLEFLMANYLDSDVEAALFQNHPYYDNKEGVMTSEDYLEALEKTGAHPMRGHYYGAFAGLVEPQLRERFIEWSQEGMRPFDLDTPKKIRHAAERFVESWNLS